LTELSGFFSLHLKAAKCIATSQALAALLNRSEKLASLTGL